MQYDFDAIIDRRHTNSVKWDGVGERLGNPDAIPMWVADADFVSPEPVRRVLEQQVRHGIYGYPARSEQFQRATIDWAARRYGAALQADWLVFTIGIVPILYTMVQAATQPGDEVIVQQPVYHPFMNAVRDQGRRISNNALLYREGRYDIDFEDLERRAARPEAKLMFFCNPHNPVGRAWTKEEVDRVCRICLENHVLLVSDEIHADLTLFGRRHHTAAVGTPAYEQNTVLCYAPSKTFNIAGIRGSCAVIPNGEVRSRFLHRLRCNDSVQESLFSLPAYVAAYTQCDDYLAQLLPYLEGNVRYLADFLQTHMPRIRLVQPGATYLMWLDCSGLGLRKDALYDFFINRSLVGVSPGEGFGSGGEQFVRMNIACPRATLERACGQLRQQYALLFDGGRGKGLGD